MNGWIVDHQTRALGFPLPAVVLRQTANGRWLGHLGQWSIMMFVLDAGIGAGLGLLVAVVILGRWAAGRDVRSAMLEARALYAEAGIAEGVAEADAHLQELET